MLYALGAALAVCGLSGPSAIAASSGSNPTQAQITKAVRAAERSSGLWATVNLCNNRRYPHELGLRGQMPGLGFASNLQMTFEVYYRSGSRFKLDHGITQRMSLGSHSGRSLHQTGVTFSFTSAAVLEGKITFTWKRNGVGLGQITRTTTGHHKHVDFGAPRGHSAARCAIR